MRRLLLGLALASVTAFAPYAVQAGDQEIATHIEQKLSEANRDGLLKDFSIDLQVSQGIVWFKGDVASEAHERLILTTAQRAKHLGVVKIIDEISIVEAKKPATQQIAKNPVLKPTAPQAPVVAPVAQAPQVAPISQQAIQAPHQIARKTVVPAVNFQAIDQAIIGNVEQKLIAAKERGELKNFKLDMQSTKGVLLLKGLVSSKQHEDLILKTANSAKGFGIVNIIDQIEVVVAPEPQVAQAAPRVAPRQAAPRQVAPQQVAQRPVLAAQPVGTGAVAAPQQHRAAQDRHAARAYYNQQANAQQQIRQTANYTGNPGEQVVAPPQQMPVAQQQMPRAQQQTTAAPQQRRAPQVPLSSRPVARVAQNMMPTMGGQQANLRAPNYMPVSERRAAAQYDHPQMPNYAWPAYAAHPNYGAVTYPQQYSPSAWPYIGPFYPYPQVPLGWRKVTMEWDDGWWYLDFQDH